MAKRKRKKLGNNTGDVDGRIFGNGKLVERHDDREVLTSQSENLVETRRNQGEKDTEEPHAESVDWHCGVIDAGNCCPYFWVWGFTDGQLANV